jgi:hypothetical protein
LENFNYKHFEFSLARIKSPIKYSLRIILPALLISFTFVANAQTYYSVDPTYLKKRTDKSPFTYFYPDTTIEKANRFINRNFMGNLGLPSPGYILKFNSRSLGFKLRDLYLDDYTIKKEDIEYFQTKGPFAELSGISGTKQLQLFRILFSNTFKKRLNISLRLNRYTSQGFYAKQQSFTNNFYTSANYTSKNKRFGFTAYVLVNNNRFQENGGIKKDTLSQADLLESKELLKVKLTGASHDNRELSAQYANWFKLNRDSARLHSFIGIHTSFSSYKYKYKDNNLASDNYYSIFYLDTVKTVDSTRLRTFNNEISYTLRSNKRNFNLELSYENEIAQLWQFSDTSFMNHFANAKLDRVKNYISADSLRSKRLSNSVSGSYIFAGPFTGNYKAESYHQLLFLRNNKTKASVTLRLQSEERTPDYIFKHWYSNHFRWDNKFNNMRTNQAELSVKYDFITVTGIYKYIANYLYFDRLSFPMQLPGNIVNASVKVGVDKVFFKHLGVAAAQTWQGSSSAAVVLPKSVSIASLFYRGNLFKKNLQLCVGGQIEYYDEFVPYAYMPATQIFYIQDQFKAGNFTFVDVFLNARIRPVTFFIKMENVLHGIIGTNYSMVPGYYQPDRAFRFGLTWLFFD